MDWAHQLLGRSGIGMNGIAPLTYSTIGEWSRLTATPVHPHEVEALIVIDAVMRGPGKPDKDEQPVAEKSERRAWPTRKPAAP